MIEPAKFIVHKKKVLRQYNNLKEITPNITYSFKTNNEVAKVLEEETDSYFSIHMEESLPLIKDKSRIWFLTQAITPGQLERLFNQGIRKFIIDNEPDIEKMLEFLEKSKHKIDLLLRLNIRENTLHTAKYFVFGMKSETIKKWLKVIKKHPNIKKTGIHFHRKTQNVGEWSIKEELMRTFGNDYLKIMDIINIGGGLPAKYKNSSDKTLPIIFKRLKELKKWLDEHNIELWLEPGRYIAAPSVDLETTIIGIYENTIVVNASIYNSAMDTQLLPLKLLIKGEKEKNEGKRYIIKGYTPCSLDMFRYRVYLKNPKVGDKITFINAGAYNFTTDFCNLKKLKTEYKE